MVALKVYCCWVAVKGENHILKSNTDILITGVDDNG